MRKQQWMRRLLCLLSGLCFGILFRFNFEVAFTQISSSSSFVNDAARFDIGKSSILSDQRTPLVPSLSQFRRYSGSTGRKKTRTMGCSKMHLDFVIAGFEKCGTTWLMRHVFGRTDQVYMGSPNSKHAKEIHLLEDNDVEEFMELYRGRSNRTTGEGRRILNGYKSPGTLKSKSSFDNLQRFFPDTRFVVTLRHPILWFQSLYNFKLRTRGNLSKPEACMGNCGEDCWKGLKRQNQTSCAIKKPCTGGSNFHHYLSRLGWTPMEADHELSLLDHHKMSIHKFPDAQMLLMEIGQMEGSDLKVTNRLMTDMEDFLGLEERTLPRFHKRAREQTNYTARVEAKHEGAVLHICDEEHSLLREHLLEIAKKSSDWITQYFVHSKHVQLSSANDFLRRMDRWKHDPCLTH